MANGWTQERRSKQSNAIHAWKPWVRATGPRSVLGKEKASRNAYKGGERPLLRDISRALEAAYDLCKGREEKRREIGAEGSVPEGVRLWVRQAAVFSACLLNVST